MCELIVAERDFSFTTSLPSVLHGLGEIRRSIDIPPPPSRLQPLFLNSELKQRRFRATNVPESGLLAFLGNVFAQTFGKIVSIRHSVRPIW